MELYHANQQWRNRPTDETFNTLEAAHAQATLYRQQATEVDKIGLQDMSVVASRTVDANGGGQEVEEVLLKGKSGKLARMSHWAFGQVAKYAGAPADFLRTLPVENAVNDLNYGLKQRAKDALVNLLFHQNGGLLLRAFTSDIYSRIWNNEVTERLLGYQDKGWVPARPTFRQSDDDHPALYVSDHDMFAFITHPDRVIKEEGNERGLLRGLIAINSEVGARKIILMRFLYREMCGNHIIWGAEEVMEMSAKHVGNVRGQFALWEAEVRKYADASTTADEQAILTTQRKRIAGNKDDLLDALFGKRVMSKKALEASYAAIQPEDGDPLTYWGFAQGVTRYSQTVPYADKRSDIDAAAGKILKMAF